MNYPQLAPDEVARRRAVFREMVKSKKESTEIASLTPKTEAELKAARERHKQEEQRKTTTESIRRWSLPFDIFIRFSQENPPRASYTVADVAHVCPLCHKDVAAYPMTVWSQETGIHRAYMRMICTCEREYEEREKQREEKKKAIASQRQKLGPYTWISPDYSTPGLNDLTFQNFDLKRIQKPDHRKIVSSVLDWAELFVMEPAGNAIVYGPYGGGKTHIIAALLNEWLLQGRHGLYITAPNLFGAIDSKRTNDEDIARIIAPMKSTPLMVIDEVDRVTGTADRFSKYHMILDHRYNTENTKPGTCMTILLCNTTIKSSAYELEPWIGTAAASRMNLGLHMQFVPGEDQRLGKIAR